MTYNRSCGRSQKFSCPNHGTDLSPLLSELLPCFAAQRHINIFTACRTPNFFFIFEPSHSERTSHFDFQPLQTKSELSRHSDVMDRLPDEILLLIFKKVSTLLRNISSPSGYDHMRQYAQLSLVNTTFCRIAMPLLYQAIECGPELRLITGLATTLATTPQLGKYIQSIRIKHARAQHVSRTRCMKDGIRGANSVQLSSWLSKIYPEHPYPFKISCYMSREVLLALCVLEARNLQSLWIDGPRDANYSFKPSYALVIQTILESAMGKPVSTIHRFERMRTLHLNLEYCEPRPSRNFGTNSGLQSTQEI